MRCQSFGTSRFTFARTLAIAVFVAGVSSFAAAADGDLDVTFGNGGFILLNSLIEHSPPIDTRAQSIAIDGSGRIVVAGSGYHIDASGNQIDQDFLLFRLTLEGSVDATFASDDGGYRMINFDLTGIGAFGNDTATDLAIQSDAKIVAVGNAFFNATQSHFAALRVDDSGTLDPTFGSGGTAHFGAFTAYSNSVGSMALDAAGDLILAGSTSSIGGLDAVYKAAVARLTSSGRLDASFNSGFVQEFNFSPPQETAQDNYVMAVGVDGSGRILAAGGYDTSTISAAAVARLDAAGLLDASFAGGAPAPIPQPFFAATAIHVSGDGSFMVAGDGFGGGQGYIYLAKFLSDGNPDVAFGTNGIASFPFGPSGLPTLIAPTKRGGWLMAGPYAQQGVFIAKVLADGEPDTTLGGTGLVSALYEPNTLFDFRRPALTADGKLIAVGSLLEASANGVGTIGVIRMLADFDTIFVAAFDSH